MPTADPNDIDPIRPGAAPTLDIPLIAEGAAIQPAWFRLTTALVKWLRFHFSDVTRIEHPNLVSRLWTPDKEASQIFISSLAEFAPTAGQQRPSLLVDRLDQQKDMQNRGIGDQLQGGKPGRYSHFVQGRHVVHCVGGLEGEAEALAFEVWRDLTRFAQRAAPCLGLMRFFPTGVGKRVKLGGEHGAHYTIPIEISYSYNESWRLFPTDEAEITAINVLVASL